MSRTKSKPKYKGNGNTSGMSPSPSPEVSARVVQKRGHAGHSHEHAHDTSFLTSNDKTDAGVRITRIGLYVNLGMAISKALGGYVFNSKALMADAIHSLTDLISDFMTLATVSWSMKPPSQRFPHGYGKVESLGSLGVSGILLMTGAAMGWSAIFELCGQFVPGFADVMHAIGMSAGHSHGHGGGEHDLGPNINAAWLAAASIAIKEWLYRASMCQVPPYLVFINHTIALTLTPWSGGL